MSLVWELVGLGVVLALNNAFAAMALGSDTMGRWRQLRIAVTFAVFEAFMPVIGVALGSGLAGAVGAKAHTIGVAVLALTGLYSLLKREAGEDERRGGRAKTFVYAVVLSMDNLAVGFSLGMFSVPIAWAALVFGLVSLLLTFLGLEVGRLLKRRLRLSADRFSGAILLATACVMLFI